MKKLDLMVLVSFSVLHCVDQQKYFKFFYVIFPLLNSPDRFWYLKSKLHWKKMMGPDIQTLGPLLGAYINKELTGGSDKFKVYFQ